MKKINFIFAVHNHQPVGNFEWVFEKGYRESYFPFLDVLQAHPKIKASLHYSGVLYDWLEAVHPGLLERVEDMAGSGQIELLTGAYYEPILPLIPDNDKIGQIRSFSSRLEERFDFSPTGMWLAERVWEPALAKPIVQAGVDYTLIDDVHFKAAGLRDEELFGYYLTEEAGFSLRLFPISQRLRYLIPFASKVEEVIEYLRDLATPLGERLIVFGDDGEKFGLWPTTYDWVYKKKWLGSFFTALERNQDWIKMWDFKKWLKEKGSLGRLYLPTCSYQEMGEWALPASAIPLYEELIDELKEHGKFEQFKGFLKGGFHRNFLSKYPEANLMHKKMLYVSNKIDRFSREFCLNEARSHLYKAQCNCPYWHGVFGGLYLPHLRRAIYNHLIEAESIVDKMSHTESSWLDDEVVDFDKDGYSEILINTPEISLYLAPHQGGCLFELDHKRKNLNLLDTLARRSEGYHRKLLGLDEEIGRDGKGEAKSIHEGIKVKEEGLENYLIYDKYPRRTLLDHFLGPQTTLTEFGQIRYDELGDFITGSYKYALTRKGEGIFVVLEREGKVKTGGRDLSLTLKKRIGVQRSETSIEIEYELSNISTHSFESLFGVEFNFVAGTEGRDNPVKSKKTKSFELGDKQSGLKVILKFEKPADIWQFPVYTVSQSDEGFERIHQCTCLLPHWHLSLSGNDLWSTKISIQIR